MPVLEATIEVSESGRKKPKYVFENDLRGELTLLDFLEFTKGALIVIADTVLKEELAKGFDPQYLTVVDGNKSKRVADVHPLGQIEFYARQQIGDILTGLYEKILELSPVLTGRYKSSNFIFLNGVQIATDMAELKSWLSTNPKIRPDDKIRFVNIQPYARKLERQGIRAEKTPGGRVGNTRNPRTVKSNRGGREHIRINQPNGTYFLAIRSVRYKYKNNVTAKFEFITGASMGISDAFKTGKKHQVGRTYLYPSITIQVAEGGTL